jgi:hypothetical protein
MTHLRRCRFLFLFCASLIWQLASRLGRSARSMTNELRGFDKRKESRATNPLLHEEGNSLGQGQRALFLFCMSPKWQLACEVRRICQDRERRVERAFQRRGGFGRPTKPSTTSLAKRCSLDAPQVLLSHRPFPNLTAWFMCGSMIRQTHERLAEGFRRKKGACSLPHKWRDCECSERLTLSEIPRGDKFIERSEKLGPTERPPGILHGQSTVY